MKELLYQTSVLNCYLNLSGTNLTSPYNIRILNYVYTLLFGRGDNVGIMRVFENHLLNTGMHTVVNPSYICVSYFQHFIWL